MAVLSETDQKASLDFRRVLSDSTSILFGNFIKVLALAFVASLAGFVVDGFVIGFDAAPGLIEPIMVGTGYIATILQLILIDAVFYGLTTALLVQLAYDAKSGRSHSLGTYIRSAVSAILHIIILSVVVTVLTYIGALAFVIGAFWVLAVFSVMVPAAVIERSGFGAMRRSATLTKDYRWPIVCAFIVVGVINGLLFGIAEFVAELALLVSPPGVGSLIAYGVAMSSIAGLGFAYAGIVSAMVYARLREIKEGVDIDQLATVFD